MTGVKRSMMAAAHPTGPPEPGLYVEEVFHTHLYFGNGGPLTITNNIDLDGEGGMLWTKQRNSDYTNNSVADTVQGRSKTLVPNNTAVPLISPANYDHKSFDSDGYTLGTPYNMNLVHSNGSPYVNWTFRKAPGFFDIVTYTGNSTGTGSQNIAHSLDAVPGFIVVRRLDAVGDWYAQWTASNDHYYKLNSDSGRISDGSFWGSTSFTPTQFQVGGTNSTTNINGATYIAYIWAAGGAPVGYGEGGGTVFGTDSDEDIIKCGGYSGNGSTTGPVISLGWEPQYILIKRKDAAGDWFIMDTMRGIGQFDNNYIIANNGDAEQTTGSAVSPTADGFQILTDTAPLNNGSGTYVYMAIRRPMKVPTAGTQVFAVDTRSNADPNWDSNFVVDMGWQNEDTSQSRDVEFYTRLTNRRFLSGSNSQIAETTAGTDFGAFDYMDGWRQDGSTSSTALSWMFKRAPGFMDLVLYTGTGSAHTVAHGLTVAPEMLFIKPRSFGNWMWFYTGFSGMTFAIPLDGGTDNGKNVSYGTKLESAPTATGFEIGTYSGINTSTTKYIAYLFASLDGISKVGHYDGDGSSQNIDCGFSGGARFVLIKTLHTGAPMFIWDTLRGIVSGDDPYLRLSHRGAEVTNLDSIDPHSAGFTVNVGNDSNLTDINKSGKTYAFLAIA